MTKHNAEEWQNGMKTLLLLAFSAVFVIAVKMLLRTSRTRSLLWLSFFNTVRVQYIRTYYISKFKV